MGSAEEDVRMMTGEPRRAIRVMSVPLIAAMLVGYLQNFIDSVWCAGLGSSAMSAITVSGPVHWTILDVGIGLGVGVSTAVARAIGAKDRSRADSMVAQSVVLAVIIGAAATVVLALVCDPVLRFMNNGADVTLCWEYVLPHLVCTIPFSVHGVLIGLLRSEGASRKVLLLSVVSTALNIVVDPLLIYTLGMGLTGAAVATCISTIVPLAIAMWWYLSGKMYLRMSFRGFRIRMEEMYDIIYVGGPHMLELMAISLLMIPQNMLVMLIGGELGIVLALTPYKFIMLAAMPAQGLAQSMIPVTSALQGAGEPARARSGFIYTILLSTVVCLVMSLFLAIFAGPLTMLYTYSDSMIPYHAKMTEVLRMYAIIVLFAGLTEVFSGILQSLRRPLLSSVTTFLRECLYIGMYVAAIPFGMEAIYLAMVFGMFAGAVLMGVFAWYCIRNMKLGKTHADPA